MRAAALAALLALLVVPAGAAGPAVSGKTIGARGRVAEISADGARVAIHSTLDGDRSCDSGSVWTPASGAVVRLQDVPCGKRASDGQYSGLGLAGTRVAWADYDYGNHAYCNGPYTATLAAPKPVGLGACPDEPDNTDMYWEFAGDGGLLVARSYFACVANCAPDYDRTYDADVAIWRIDGSARRILSPPNDTKLLSVAAGQILLFLPGKLAVYTALGKLVWSQAAAGITRGALDGGRVLAQKGTSLLVYSAKGGAPESRALPKGARLEDADGGVAVYSAAGAIHLVRLADGRDRVVATVKGLVQAQLEPAGLTYAYNLPGGGSKPGRVAFVPHSQLP